MFPPTAGSVTSVKVPPFILGEDTSSTYPSQNTPPLISVLKLFRKLNVAAAEVTLIFRVSRYLSLIPSWSGIKASLGAVSGLMVEVTHISGSGVPTVPFVATHPAGSAGAVTPSKFSMQPVFGLVGLGVAGGGVGVAGGTVGVGVGVGGGDPTGVPVGDGVVIGVPMGVGV